MDFAGKVTVVVLTTMLAIQAVPSARTGKSSLPSAA